MLLLLLFIIVIESLLFPVLIICVLFDWSVSLKTNQFFFFFCDNNIILTSPPHPSPPPHLSILKLWSGAYQWAPVVVQFYLWSKFSFLLFHTYLSWQQPTLVVDSGDSLFLTSPLSPPTVNSPNNPTTGRRNKSSKQDPRVALCCSLVFI